MNGGLAGLSVSGERLILAERDFDEEHDVYRCLNADNGELLWRAEFPAAASWITATPRATPVIHADKAYLLGAFGDLRCVNLTNGKVIWQRSLPREFKATLPTWGMCSTPLIVDDMLIVNPGGTNASLVALDCATRPHPLDHARITGSLLGVYLRGIWRSASRGLRPAFAGRLGVKYRQAPLATRAFRRWRL